MAMLDLTAETSTEVLESLDFPVGCDHSQHSKSPSHHEGAGEFVAKVTHDCPNRPGVKGEIYVCCSKWAKIVEAHADKPWACPVCYEITTGREMVIIVGPLDLM